MYCALVKVSGAAVAKAIEVLQQLDPLKLYISEEFAKRGRGSVRLRDTGARAGVKLYTIVPTEKPQPVVVEIPAAVGAGLLGSMVDAWDEPMADIGPAGEDQGKGGKYLLLPPDFRGETPPGFFALKYPTYNGYAVSGDPRRFNRRRCRSSAGAGEEVPGVPARAASPSDRATLYRHPRQDLRWHR